MQTVVTGRVPRRSLGALSTPAGLGGLASGAFPLTPLALRGSVVAPVGIAGVMGAALAPLGSPPQHLIDAAAAHTKPLPLPLRFSSLGGCSLLDAKVAISSVRRSVAWLTSG